MDQKQEKQDFTILLINVGTYYDNLNDINKLKVLYRDHIEETKKLEKAENTMQLFQYLEDSGKLSLKDPKILYDTIHITKYFKLQHEVKKHIPDCPNIENEIEISTFSDYRQKLFNYGFRLSSNELKRISEYYLRGKYYPDSWEMIVDQERRKELTEDKIDGFIEKFRGKQFDQVHRLPDNANSRSKYEPCHMGHSNIHNANLHSNALVLLRLKRLFMLPQFIFINS